MGAKTDQPLLVKGKRLDGRKPDEMRKMTIKAGVISQADGSAEFQLGETVAIASVFGPRRVIPKHLEEATQSYLNVKYDMAPFSTSDRNRPGPSRRSKEISKVMKDALTPAIYLKRYPQTKIDVYVEILNANAGTRTAAINAASVALADAGIEMKSLISSIAAGKIDSKIVLDLFQEEDNFGQADVPMAFDSRNQEITLLQMDGHLTKEELKKAMDMCKKACVEISNLQIKALKDKYKKECVEVK